MRGYYGNNTALKIDSFPTGTNSPYALMMGDKGALISATTTISGVGSLVSGMAMGRSISATLEGSGNLTAGLSLIVQFASELSGSGGLTAGLVGTLQMAANLIGSGDLVGGLGLLANISATLNGTGDIVGSLRGTASMSASITPFTELSPESLAASVWAAIANQNNISGSMGEKLNDAGSASNPWTEVIEGTYTAAEVLRLLASVAGGKSTIVDNGNGNATITFRDINDTTDRVVADVTDGSRNSLTLDI
jgi:hypothetical protein